MICILKFAKGHISVKVRLLPFTSLLQLSEDYARMKIMLGGVMVLGLFTSSDNAIYWYRSASLVLAPVFI